METSSDNDQKRIEFPCMEKSRDLEEMYESNIFQLHNLSLTFIVKNFSLLSATTVISQSPLIDNTTASSNKLACTAHVNFVKRRDRFRIYSWSKRNPTT